MTPARAIWHLDNALRRYGQDVLLQRLTTDNSTGEQTIAFEARCRASVRAHQPQELEAMSGEAPNTEFVLSPTDLARESWPGLPAKDDRIIIAGRPGNIETVSPISLDGTLVRIDLQSRE